MVLGRERGGKDRRTTDEVIEVAYAPYKKYAGSAFHRRITPTCHFFVMSTK